MSYLSPANAEAQKLRFCLVGSYLKDKRMAAGLTQRDVATALAYNSPQFISNWERGVSLPPLDTLPILTQLFKVSAQDMIQVLSAYQSEMLAHHRLELASAFAKG